MDMRLAPLDTAKIARGLKEYVEILSQPHQVWSYELLNSVIIIIIIIIKHTPEIGAKRV